MALCAAALSYVTLDGVRAAAGAQAALNEAFKLELPVAHCDPARELGVTKQTTDGGRDWAIRLPKLGIAPSAVACVLPLHFLQIYPF